MLMLVRILETVLGNATLVCSCYTIQSSSSSSSSSLQSRLK